MIAIRCGQQGGKCRLVIGHVVVTGRTLVAVSVDYPDPDGPSAQLLDGRGDVPLLDVRCPAHGGEIVRDGQQVEAWTTVLRRADLRAILKGRPDDIRTVVHRHGR